MVTGTNYAHRIGNWEEAVSFIKQLNLPKEDMNRILGGNAAQIYHIDKSLYFQGRSSMIQLVR